MRFWSNGPRSAAVGHEFLKVGGDFGEQCSGQARGHRDDAGEDATGNLRDWLVLTPGP